MKTHRAQLLRRRVPLVRELALLDREIALAASHENARGGFLGYETPRNAAEAPLQRDMADCSGNAEGVQTPFRRSAGPAGLGLGLLVCFFLLCLGQPARAGIEVPSPFGGAATAFLAEGMMPDASVGTWILTAFVALGVIAGGVASWNKLTGRPSEPQRHNVSGGPVTVRGEIEFVAKPIFDELSGDVEKIEDDMDQMERRLNERMEKAVEKLNKERKEDISGLHKKIEDHDHRNQGRFETILEKIGELRGGKKT